MISYVKPGAKWGSLVAGVVLATALLLPTGSSANGRTVLDTSCPAGKVCFWSGHNYMNNKATFSNTNPGYHPIGYHAGSVKDGFGNRRVRYTDDSGGFQGCVDPQNPNNPNINQLVDVTRYNIGDPGSRC